MKIYLPESEVPEILEQLKKVQGNQAVQMIIEQIEKTIWDKEEVEKALEANDQDRLEELMNLVEPGFYRFQIINWLHDNEQK